MPICPQSNSMNYQSETRFRRRQECSGAECRCPRNGHERPLLRRAIQGIAGAGWRLALGTKNDIALSGGMEGFRRKRRCLFDRKSSPRWRQPHGTAQITRAKLERTVEIALHVGGADGRQRSTLRKHIEVRILPDEFQPAASVT